jgi:tRNA 2-thiouridine synthesizing protein E
VFSLLKLISKQLLATLVSDFRVDEEGFLENPATWCEDFARRVAAEETLVLTAQHWQLIRLVRQFHDQYGFPPSMRPLVKYAGMHLGPEQGRSIYLLQLFPPSPARLLCKLAGLHKPKNCL